MARTELHDALLAWIKYRDAECSAVYTNWYRSLITCTMAVAQQAMVAASRTRARDKDDRCRCFERLNLEGLILP